MDFPLINTHTHIHIGFNAGRHLVPLVDLPLHPGHANGADEDFLAQNLLAKRGKNLGNTRKNLGNIWEKPSKTPQNPGQQKSCWKPPQKTT